MGSHWPAGEFRRSPDSFEETTRPADDEREGGRLSGRRGGLLFPFWACRPLWAYRAGPFGGSIKFRDPGGKFGDPGGELEDPGGHLRDRQRGSRRPRRHFAELSRLSPCPSRVGLLVDRDRGSLADSPPGPLAVLSAGRPLQRWTQRSRTNSPAARRGCCGNTARGARSCRSSDSRAGSRESGPSRGAARPRASPPPAAPGAARSHPE